MKATNNQSKSISTIKQPNKSHDLVLLLSIVAFILVSVLGSIYYMRFYKNGQIDFGNSNVKSYVSELPSNFSTDSGDVLSLSDMNPSKNDTNNSVDIAEIQQPVRPAQVAGKFYEADGEKLNEKLAAIFSGVPYSATDDLRILVEPHAGLDYSGKIAAQGYQRIPKTKKRAIVIATSHTDHLDHIAIFNKGSWQTPLGNTPVDETYANYLIDDSVGIKSDLNAFKDHTIEMQLVMLQYELDNFKIIPILISQPTPEQEKVLANKLAYLLDKDTVLIVSSDLSHYPAYDDAVSSDTNTINAILSDSESNFRENVHEYSPKSASNLVTYACGYESIALGLKVAENLNITNFDKIAYANSGDVTGDKSRVVGYTSIIGYGGKYLPMGIQSLSNSSKKEALKIARDSISDALKSEHTLIIPNNIELYKPAGAFVTLKEKGQLRGCIGHFETPNGKTALYQTIYSSAADAAMKDSRFKPLEKNEFDDVEIEISVMTPRKSVNSYKDIELGTDGVVVQNDTNSGTFLPSVARDTSWDLDKFMSVLCTQKAHLSEDCYLDPNTKIEVFRTLEFRE